MNKPKPIAIHLDRLAAVLSLHNVNLKRTKLLEIAAAAFGYHNTHECTEASKRGDLTPPAAEVLGRVSTPDGDLLVLKDPLSGAIYAIEEGFIEQVVEEERRESYGPSPYGHLLDLSDVAASPKTAGPAYGAFEQAARQAGLTSIHVASIHSRHGISIRLGTNMASVSRQVGEYVREHWDTAWQTDQEAPENERCDLPESPDGLNDDEAEEKFFEAMGRYSASDYVDYEVIELDSTGAHPAPLEIPAFPEPASDLWEVFAARDGDTNRLTFVVAEGDDPEHEARVRVAKSFGLDLADYLEEEDDDGSEAEAEELEEEIDYSLFDSDLDGIDVYRACIDPSLKDILQDGWEAAHRLPIGDPLRERMIERVIKALPKAD